MHEIWMRFPDGKAKALTLSYDDGVEQDIRLIAILNRHNLKCTFNLNGGLFAPEGTKVVLDTAKHYCFIRDVFLYGTWNEAETIDICCRIIGSVM